MIQADNRRTGKTAQPPFVTIFEVTLLAAGDVPLGGYLSELARRLELPRATCDTVLLALMVNLAAGLL